MTPVEISGKGVDANYYHAELGIWETQKSEIRAKKVVFALQGPVAMNWPQTGPVRNEKLRCYMMQRRANRGCGGRGGEFHSSTGCIMFIKI